MEEFPNEEQAQEHITHENIKDFLTSKALKKRIAAYKEIEQYPEFVGLVQNETLTVALEPAITCLLQFKGELTNNEISNLYSQFTQTKASIKNLMNDLIDKVFLNDQSGVIKGLAANFSHKNAKVVFGCVQKVKDLIQKNFDFFKSNEGKDLVVGVMCPQLESIFSNTDKDVKSEGSLLALEIFKIIHELTLKFLENVKPIILKDLKELFSTVEIPPREVKVGELEFDHSDWKERLAALNFLKENIANMSNKNEVYSILYRKTKDPNIQVVISAVECIKRGEIKHPDCIRGIIDRFKDKKAPLTSLIKETIQLILPDINLLIDGLDVKNPDIKIGILECLRFYNTIPRAKDIGKLLDDSSADVRRLSIAVLNQADDLEGLTESQLSKLKKQMPAQQQSKLPTSRLGSADSSPKSGSKLNKNTSTDTSPNKFKVSNPLIKNTEIQKSNTALSVAKPQQESKLPLPDVKMFDSSSFEFNLDQAAKIKINDEFIEKYPFLLEKDWTKKLEAINGYIDQFKTEQPLSIVLYLICSKETNFHIFKAFLMILESFPSLETAKTPLISFLNSKITETKLKDAMVALYKKLDLNFTIQNFIYCLKTNKTGKKFLIFLEFFSLILKSKNPLVDHFLTDFRVIGAQEKKALNFFIDEYNKLGDSSSHSNIHSSEISPKTTLIDDEKSNSILNNDIKMVKFEIPSADQLDFDKKLSKGVFNNPINQSRIKNCEIEPSKIFTPDFLQLFKNDISKAVMILEKQDLALTSDYIISLYCHYSAPSTYFNSLILHFISSRYILQENEAYFLANFLVKHSMECELELMDRIYPATKLYKVFRSISNEQGSKAIFSLICKYKNLKDLKYNEIEKTVADNEDFIGFSIEIEKIIKMKEELRKRYENPEDNQHNEAIKGNTTAFKEINNEGFTQKQEDNNINTCNSSKSIFVDATVISISKSGIQHQKIDGSFRVENDQRNKEASLCLNSNEDQADINDLEDSIIIEATPSIDQTVPDPLHVTASVIIASSVTDVDSLTSTVIHSNTDIDRSEIKNENLYKNAPLLTDGNASFEIPETTVDGQNAFDHEIEQSLENISISTTPQKKKRNFNQVESYLDSIMAENETESKNGLENISKMVSNDPQALLFSCNTILSTLLNQLKNKYDDIETRDMILSILLKFTQNSDICTAIRYETLVFINTILIPIVKDNVLIADILINLCLNCDLQILRVYFDLLNNTDEILMKLIWRHSKKVNYSSTENSAVVVRIIDSFYQSKRDFLYKAENIVLKVCLLHLKECISVFSDNIKEFGISEITNSIVNLLITTKDLNLEAIRVIYKK